MTKKTNQRSMKVDYVVCVKRSNRKKIKQIDKSCNEIKKKILNHHKFFELVLGGSTLEGFGRETF